MSKCNICGKWAGAHATLPGQPRDHLCHGHPVEASARALAAILAEWKIRKLNGCVTVLSPVIGGARTGIVITAEDQELAKYLLYRLAEDMLAAAPTPPTAPAPCIACGSVDGHAPKCARERWMPTAPAQDAQGVAPLLSRAIELHEKAGMPWVDAEELALSEAGIDDAILDELIGEAGYSGLESMLTTVDELRRFTRSILVHQPLAALRASSPADTRDVIGAAMGKLTNEQIRNILD